MPCTLTEMVDKLRELPEFENTLLIGNPFYELLKDDAKYYALKKIPNLKNIDGLIVQATFAKKSQEFPDVCPPAIRWFDPHLDIIIESILRVQLFASFCKSSQLQE